MWVTSRAPTTTGPLLTVPSQMGLGLGQDLHTRRPSAASTSAVAAPAMDSNKIPVGGSPERRGTPMSPSPPPALISPAACQYEHAAYVSSGRGFRPGTEIPSVRLLLSCLNQGLGPRIKAGNTDGQDSH